ncbi:MAG: hypothetical protein IJX80_01720 [Clostridia bacterium]|nr:hypothetical protein [Clostridia bacterium]
MKNIIKLVALSLVLVMAMMALASCGDKSGAIKSAFEGEGYTVSSSKYEDLSSGFQTIVKTVLGEEVAAKMADYEIITCTKIVPLAIVIKFPAEGDIKTALTVEDDTSLFDELKAEGAINGNCMILTLTPGALEIFKNA